jgi:tetratricopeptide (TPR) repeat protein
MTKKEIAERLKEIKSHIKDDMEDFAAIDFKELALEIHNDQKYHLVIENFNKIKKLVSNQVPFYCFELAYAFERQEDQESSEIIYEYLNAENGENSAVLNNLSNIKKGNRKFKEAFQLISKAYEISPDDEVISNNYDSLYQIISDLDEREQKFKHSLTYIERENKFVINKLKSFIQNAKKDKDFKNGLIPIPKWKFKVLMVTDDDKSESLRNQWLDKNYIIDTGERGDYYVIVYEINPFLEKAISELTLNFHFGIGIKPFLKSLSFLAF